MARQMDEQIHKWMDIQTDECTDRWADGQTDEWTEREMMKDKYING